MTVGEIIYLAVATVFAGTLSAVTGFGGAAILLPLLIPIFGARDSVPILTVAQLIGNGSRAVFNRRDLDRAVIVRFAAGAVPAAVLGAVLFTRTPSPLLTRLLGAFLLCVVVCRQLAPQRSGAMPLRGFTILGAISSFLSAIIGSVGPLMAPFFLAYGLVKRAYIGTEAAASLIMHGTKAIVYGGTAMLAPSGVVAGACLGTGLLIGSYFGKRIVDRISSAVFVLLIETSLAISGLILLFS